MRERENGGVEEKVTVREACGCALVVVIIVRTGWGFSNFFFSAILVFNEKI